MTTMRRTEKLLYQMESLEKSSDVRKRLEARLNMHIQDWVKRVERLGCEAKGLWLVDFDCGAGYFCWQYGEDDIAFFHGYSEGFTGRRPIHQIPTARV